MIKIVKSWYDFAVVSGGVANHFAYKFLSGHLLDKTFGLLYPL